MLDHLVSLTDTVLETFHLDLVEHELPTWRDEKHISDAISWAGRLEKDFARVVAKNISLMLATDQVDVYPWDASFKPRYQVILDVLRFEGRFNQKDVFLEVFWKIIDPQKKMTLVAKKSAIKESLTATDYETLVATKSRVVAELSKVIIKEIYNL